MSTGQEHSKENSDEATNLSITSLKAENAALERKISELQQREQANSELLATVSHEIRTPIGAVMSMIELLQTTGLNENQQKYAKTLQLASNNLAILTDDILNFARLESGQVKIKQETFELSKFLETVTTSIRPRAEAKGLYFKLEIEQGCPVLIKGDQSRLSQIINNLANNALKFTQQGGLHLKLSAEPLEAVDGEFLIRVEMQDTGIGINSAEQEKLFTPFGQANSSIQTRFGGSGLGLCISRKLAERMGGTMSLSSQQDVGSRFWFTFKAKQQSVAKGETPQSETIAKKDTPLKGHVLIVEDNLLNQMLIKTYLDKFGLTYDLANNGIEALELVKGKSEPANAQTYDLILMDIMMPKMDGITTTKELIKLWHGEAPIPILALTANVLDDQVRLYFEAGMSGYVSKPFKGEELYLEVDKVLNFSRDQQALSA